MGIDELKRDKMMAHLIGSLEAGQDIGHYGRLVFTMVARHFLPEDELLRYLQMDPAFDETKARALLDQVSARDYNPPRRERIEEWMQKQGFPICPDPADPNQCNVYRHLTFPDEVYEKIGQFHERRAQAESNAQES